MARGGVNAIRTSVLPRIGSFCICFAAQALKTMALPFTEKT